MFITYKQYHLEINGLKDKIGKLEEEVARLAAIIDGERLKSVTVAGDVVVNAADGLDVLLASALSEKASHALSEAGYTTLSQLDGLTDEDLLAITGIGPAKLAEIRDLQKQYA